MNKILVYLLVIGAVMFSCNTSRTAKDVDELPRSTDQDTVRIENEELEYQIIIIEPGFNSWLLSRARPEGYYSQQFLENRNQIYVTEWNNRARQQTTYGRLYEMPIDYEQSIDYGYEVNYKLYYYFIYFQMTYNQRLGPFIPRI